MVALEERGSLWPTATDAKASGAAGYSTESGRHAGTTLTDAVVRMDGLYPSPSASSYGSNRGGSAGRVGPIRESLETMARRETWATPRAGNAGSGADVPTRNRQGGVSLVTQTGGRLSPRWTLVLMGFPEWWFDIPSPPAVERPNSRGSRRARSRAT